MAKSSVSDHAIYMREYRRTHPEQTKYQSEYHKKYIAKKSNRDKARRRAAEWYAKYRDQLLKGHATGARNPQWMGEDVGYAAVHDWIVRYKGRARKCSECGKTGRRIHWSNKDHKYRRILDDYVERCASCHYRYDTDNGLRPVSTGKNQFS